MISSELRNGQAAFNDAGEAAGGNVGAGVFGLLTEEVDDGGTGVVAGAAGVEPPEHAVMQVSRHAAAKNPPVKRTPDNVVLSNRAQDCGYATFRSRPKTSVRSKGLEQPFRGPAVAGGNGTRCRMARGDDAFADFVRA